MTMSTGERRRVLIARALVHQPEAIVLDEPTTGLDVAASASFMRIVRSLAQSGITIILVTHHLEEVIPEIRNAILLKAGRVHAQGHCDALLNSSHLSDLFSTNVEVKKSLQGRFAMIAESW